MAFISKDDSDAWKRISEEYGSNLADRSLRKIIQMCWMMLPEERRNADELEKEVQTLLDKIFHELRSDFEAFWNDCNR